MTDEKPEITRTTRDRAELHDLLEAWLGTRVADARITELAVPDNGMSSETVLFGASWTEDASTVEADLVARLAAAEDAVPVFPHYDLGMQYRVIARVGEHTDAPVPQLRWNEEDPGHLGCPFFVMDRAHGWVPQDVLPYTMDGPMLETPAEDLRHLQDASVDVLAEIHRTPLGADTGFLEYDQPGDTALRRHVNHWLAYKDWVVGDRRVPVIEDAAAWLEDNWPAAADGRPPALSWGDARIGNIMYDGFDPVAVFDWEMAGIAPVEVDLGWMAFLHTFFQDITEDMDMPGLPDFMAADDLAARYRETSGVDIDDLHWFCTYASFRHAAIMLRIYDRQLHFGDVEAHPDLEEAVMHRARLRRQISV
jgi:aminoglycoside phosphotransferase (APT) family kinase protein